MSETISASPATAPVVEPTAPAAAAPAKPGIAAVVSAVLTSARAKFNATAELAAAHQKIAALTTERDTAKSELSALGAQLSATQAQLASIAGFFGVKPADLAGADATACAELLKAKIDTAALDAIAGMGLDTAALPKTASATDKGARRLTHSEFMALSHAERMSFALSGGLILEPGAN